jgi:hypothetical protein
MKSRVTFNAAGLSDEDIRIGAPSAYSDRPHDQVSDRYTFVPTSELIAKLRETGWSPVAAAEQRVMVDNRRGFQKHLLRFRRLDRPVVDQEYEPEVVLVNSHDRSCAATLLAGLHVFVCGNGLIVAGKTLGRISVIHSYHTTGEVLEAMNKLVDSIPAIVERVDRFRQRVLSESEQMQFATEALKLRYDPIEIAPIGAERLLESAVGNEGPDLWHTLNRVQYNLIQGGQRDGSRRRANGRALGLTRRITGLSRDVDLNRDVWALAERLADGETLALPA